MCLPLFAGETYPQHAEARRYTLAHPYLPLETLAFNEIVGHCCFIVNIYYIIYLSTPEIIDDDEVISAAMVKFKLDKEQALRVFDQEIERLHQEVVRNENIKKYQDDFEIFVMDGVITKSERDALNAIARNLSLTAEDIKIAESDYVFKEESASPAAK